MITAPEGSINLKAGEYGLSFKILLKHGNLPAHVHLNLGSPETRLALPSPNAQRGRWITMSKRFTRETASNPDDRLMIEVHAAEAPPGARDFFLDDIRIERLN